MIQFPLTYAATGEVLWIPGPGQAGDYLVRVTVSDGETTTDVQGSTSVAGDGMSGATKHQHKDWKPKGWIGEFLEPNKHSSLAEQTGIKIELPKDLGKEDD